MDKFLGRCAYCLDNAYTETSCVPEPPECLVRQHREKDQGAQPIPGEAAVSDGGIERAAVDPNGQYAVISGELVEAFATSFHARGYREGVEAALTEIKRCKSGLEEMRHWNTVLDQAIDVVSALPPASAASTETE